MIVKLRKKKLKNGKSSLYLAFWNPDERYQIKRGKKKGQWLSGRWQYEFLKLYLGKNKALNRETLKLAENKRTRRQIELQIQQHGFKPKFKKNDNFVDYFEATKEKKYPRNSEWKQALNHLRNFTGGEIAFDNINREWLENFKEYLLKRLSINTASTYFNKVVAALKMAVTDGIIEKNPGKNVNKIRMIDTKKTYLTYEEITKLVKTPCLQEEVKKAFLFGCYTGLRVSDLKRIEWGDIRRDINGYQIEFRQKKTKAFEYLPLSSTAFRFLDMKGEVNPKEKIFQIPRAESVALNFDCWTKAAGINKRVRFHVARHTFATLSLTYGVDIYTVSKLLGHRKISTTQCYTRVIDEKKRKAVDLLPTL